MNRHETSDLSQNLTPDHQRRRSCPDVIPVFLELSDEVDKRNRSFFTFAQIAVMLTNPVSNDLIALLLLIEA